MKKSFILVALTAVVTLNSSCASIVSKSEWPLTISSSPSGAKFTVTNKSGITVHTGTTPATVKLESGAGFFEKESYKILIEMDGYDKREIPVQCKLNGWYWGNIIFGGLIGLLIIDPATGAMYKLKTSSVDETLTKTTGMNENNRQLNIYDINSIPEHLKDQLVKIN